MREQWTAAEVATLRANAALGADGVALALGHRSPHAVRQYASRAKITLGVGGRPRWTASEDALLRELASENPVVACARALGRTTSAVQQRAMTGGFQFHGQRGWHGRQGSPECKMWYSAKKRAKARDLPFDITPLDIHIPERCPVLGVKLVVGVGRGPGIGPAENAPTLDRIDPSRGYVRGNIAVISWRANRVKDNATAAEHRLLADWMDAHTPPG